WTPPRVVRRPPRGSGKPYGARPDRPGALVTADPRRHSVAVPSGSGGGTGILRVGGSGRAWRRGARRVRVGRLVAGRRPGPPTWARWSTDAVGGWPAGTSR